MKFTDGMWLTGQDWTVSFPAEAYDACLEESSLTVYGPFAPVRGRGDTLNLGQLTMQITSLMEGIISVKLTHFAGVSDNGPHFDLHRQKVPVTMLREGDCCLFSSGGLTAAVGIQGRWGIRFSWEGKSLGATAPRGAAYCAHTSGDAWMREQLCLDVGENIYGLGERFTPFVKNGQSVDIWNADGGTDSEQAYKNIPFFLSNRGYGVLVNHPGRVSFEVASESASRVQFSVPGEELEYLFIGGKNLKEVLNRYTALTGRPPLLPAWTFGLWLTTSFCTDYNEEKVLSFLDGMEERDIPLTTFHFDCFWMKGFQWCDFLWDPDTFPDPAGMLRRIKARGIRVCVWINPYIAQKSRLFAEGVQNGYFVRTGDGAVWQWDMWQAGMALVDFTNPAAKAWYQRQLAQLIEMGVDCFKTDFGERIPVQDPFYGPRAARYGIRYFDGSDPEKMHNYYTLLYNQAVWEVLEDKLGSGEACLFARSATVGGQQYPVHWGGDNLANYPSMAQSLRGGLSLGLCGFGYWSHDIGGFESGCNPDIFKRWTQFGLLSSHSRYHGNSEYKVPWLYGEEAVAVTRTFTRLKHQLMPYLYGMAVEAHEQGLPILRPMLLEFPEDPTAAWLDQQYMLGDRLLVAPIWNDQREARYYLPVGHWRNLLTGELCEGGWQEQIFDYMSLPLMLRENALLPMGEETGRPDYDYPSCALLVLGWLDDGAVAETVVTGLKGEAAFQVTVAREGENLTVSLRGMERAPQPCRLLLGWLQGRSISIPAEGTVIKAEDF